MPHTVDIDNEQNTALVNTVLLANIYLPALIAIGNAFAARKAVNLPAILQKNNTHIFYVHHIVKATVQLNQRVRPIGDFKDNA